MSKPNKVPSPVLAVVADILANRYTHAQLDVRFAEKGAPGEPPEGSKVVKCQAWLGKVNETPDPFTIVGELIEDVMEEEPHRGFYSDCRETDTRKDRINGVLGRYGLQYQTGGRILGGALAPSRSLHEVLRARDLAAVQVEFERATAQITSDPPAALTAACAIIEATCKVYIEDEGLEMPPQTVKPLWATVQRHIGFDPAELVDDDLKRVLVGLTSIVDGVGSARTHASSAHGRGRKPYKIQVRHARLAVSAAHTVVMFVLETWDERKAKASTGGA